MIVEYFRGLLKKESLKNKNQVHIGATFFPTTGLIEANYLYDPLTKTYNDVMGQSYRPIIPLQYGVGDGIGYLSGDIPAGTLIRHYEGTATLSISENRLDISPGTIWRITLNNDSVYSFPTRLDSITYVWFDRSGHGRHLTCENFLNIEDHLREGFDFGDDSININGFSGGYFCAYMTPGDNVFIEGIAGASIISKQGDADIYLDGNYIKCSSSGKLYNLKLQLANYRILTIPFIEGNNIITYGYDYVGKVYYGIITTSNIINFWGRSQNDYFINYNRKVQLYGGQFMFTPFTIRPTIQMRIDTNNKEPWYLEGRFVDQGEWITVNKEEDKIVDFGVIDRNIKNLYFNNNGLSFNQDFMTHTDFLSKIRPSDSFDVSGAHNINGDLSAFSFIRSKNFRLRNFEQITGDLSDLYYIDTKEELIIISLHNITGDLESLQKIEATTIRIEDCPLVEGDIAYIAKSTLLNLTIMGTLVDTCSASTGILQNCIYCQVSNNDLNATAVDNLLIALDNNDLLNGEFKATGGTNSSPTALGQVAITNLTSKGWLVETN